MGPAPDRGGIPAAAKVSEFAAESGPLACSPLLNCFQPLESSGGPFQIGPVETPDKLGWFDDEIVGVAIGQAQRRLERIEVLLKRVDGRSPVHDALAETVASST